MKRLLIISVLAVAGLGLSAGSAAAQYRYNTRYNPYTGGYVTNQSYSNYLGAQQQTSYYNPYTGYSTSTYGYTNPYSTGYRSYGYSPYNGGGYYRQFNSSPLGYSGYGYRY